MPIINYGTLVTVTKKRSPAPLPNTLYFYNPTSPFTIATRANATSGTTYGVSSNRTLQYSTDGTTWTNWNGRLQSVAANQKFYVRGTITGAGSISLYTNFVIPSGYAICRGDIRHLDTLGVPTSLTVPYDYNYFSLFYACKVTPEIVLPATTLTTSCYRSMFNNSSGFTTAPALPATTLATYCYANMFKMSSLVTAPALPATVLVANCYSFMYLDCIQLSGTVNIAAAPTTLPNSAIDQMFNRTSTPSGTAGITTVTGAFANLMASPTTGTNNIHVFTNQTKLTSPVAYASLPTGWK